MDDVSSMVESSSKVRNVYILMEGPDSRLETRCLLADSCLRTGEWTR